jgi:hypothetical protein
LLAFDAADLHGVPLMLFGVCIITAVTKARLKTGQTSTRRRHDVGTALVLNDPYFTGLAAATCATELAGGARRREIASRTPLRSFRPTPTTLGEFAARPVDLVERQFRGRC